MKKRIITIAVVIAVVSILSIVLVACNATNYRDRLQKAGYDITLYKEVAKADQDTAYEEGYKAGLIFIVSATKANLTGSNKGLSKVTVMKFKKISDAKKFFEESLSRYNGDEKYRVSNLIIYGTAQGVKDVK